MSETLRVATYNVHGCVGIDGQRSEARIAEVIASMNADVVGLQELDANRQRSAHVKQAELIGQQLGWHHIFEPAMQNADEQYGNAIISRFPLSSRRSIQLPGEGSWYCRETRIALWAEAVTQFGQVSIVNTHFALGRAERFRQAELLARELTADEPLILLGDFNSLPGSRSIKLLSRVLRNVRTELNSPRLHRTYPTRLPAIAVDHIFASPGLRPLSIASHRTVLSRVASDHFPLVAAFAAS
ncbi:MAG: endonuclease/exonuclease/phosphatase family protein [Verrucomicrobiota bacterium]|nr:endonuclease/exonuclease/phosphatase family protein [Verrucomicrobiota bacterium]